MAVKVQGIAVPAGASVGIRIEMTAQVNVTASVARQKATRFVITHISTQLRGEAPDLHVGERIGWSVPIVLTSPARGVVGKVGDLLVDADTGEVLTEGDTLRRIAADAEHLAQRAALQAGA